MRCAFTLLELIIAILILVVLIALVLPATGNIRRAAYRAQCANQLKIIGESAHLYRDTHGHFPPGTVPGTQLPPDQRLSFYTLLLPKMDGMKPAADKFIPTEPWDSRPNRAAVGQFGERLFMCAEWYDGLSHEGRTSMPGWPNELPRLANYVGIAGVGSDAAGRAADAPGIGMFGFDRVLKTEQVKDGLANTLLLIETGHEVGPWARGGPTTVRAIDPTLEHLVGGGLPFGGTHYRERAFRPNVADGFVALLADGSTRFTQREVSPTVLIALSTVADGDSVPAEW
jgi:prepilin-type N-terminal cleavage/methylation domain-containing protein